MRTVPLSILDLAAIGPNETIAESFRGSVELARLAERSGYRRVWYAEHHSIESIASAATSVLIAHVAAHTSRIRLGAGGVMLPNHSPLAIAEQFGTLAELHPGRIDLGLGRAPGGDPRTFAALRRRQDAAERFPEDVLELQGWLSKSSPVAGVTAIPGRGTEIPLYILGSSLFGARLAGALGLPYAFASHFAPAALHQAASLYRKQFQPSFQCDAPYFIAGINVIAADTEPEAQSLLATTRRLFAQNLARRGSGQPALSDEELLASPHAAFVEQMFTYRAVGTPDRVVSDLVAFQKSCGADELITVHHTTSVRARLHSVELVAHSAELQRDLG